MNQTLQRSQLSEFLRSCRARREPASLGLRPAARRRSKGLRREDVAALAGLSATWYTWLEQGRNVHPSEQILERLSAALGLSAAERDYLFMLAQRRPPPLAPALARPLRPAVQRMLDGVNVPALVHTRRWDVVAWNPVWSRCFPDFAKRPAGSRNLLRILLTEPDFQRDPGEQEEIARRILPTVRLDYSQAGDDPAFDALLAELSMHCPVFDRLWHSPEISHFQEGIYATVYPGIGTIRFEHTAYAVASDANLRLLMFSPAEADSADRFARLMREHRD
ncbi:MAG TPA: helix-turn-helix transcriptional regulator [Steroidobacteraceae bacterium]|nr:helix-turn-helix transcriptional regulator [Steroidobacteraceae bacterium]